MQRRLVPFDGTRFLAVDKVALARTAAELLRSLPVQNVDEDYGIETLLRPLLERALAGRVDVPVFKRQDILGGRYFFERIEGCLPPEFSARFNSALSRFLVRAMSLPLDQPQLEVEQGQAMAWVEFEEPGDWPNAVRYP